MATSADVVEAPQKEDNHGNVSGGDSDSGSGSGRRSVGIGAFSSDSILRVGSPPPSFADSQQHLQLPTGSGKPHPLPPHQRPALTAPAKAWQRRGNALNAQKLCGFVGHVERAAFFVGAFGTLTTSLLIIFLMKLDYSIQHVVFAAIVFTSYFLVFLAEETRMPSLMWLYLILNPICIGLIVGAFIYPSMVFLVGVDLFDKDEANTGVVKLARVMASAEMALSVIGILTLAYFQSIVFRAYRWMRKQRLNAAIAMNFQ